MFLFFFKSELREKKSLQAQPTPTLQHNNANNAKESAAKGHSLDIKDGHLNREASLEVP